MSRTHNLANAGGPPIRWHVGAAMDHLLADAMLLADAEPAAVLKAVRMILRSGRPDHDFVWPPEAVDALSALRGAVDGTAWEAIADAIGLGDQSHSYGQVESRRGKLGPSADSAHLDLEHFRTTTSFDSGRPNAMAKIEEHLNADDPMDIVIRGHLWIESALNAVLERALPNPAALRDARLSFSQRTSLVAALQLIPPDEVKLIRAVNKLRNRVAHDLDHEVTIDDQRSLLGAAGSTLLETSGARADGSFPSQIAAIIAAVVFALHARADDLDAGRRYGAYLHDVTNRTLGRS